MKSDIVELFYQDIPFNYSEDIKLYLDSIKNSNQILEYKDLHHLLTARKNLFFNKKIKNIIEFGCGTGWLSNTISYYYKKNMTSVDFTKRALEIAVKVSEKLRLDSNYCLSDLFLYEDKNKYDLVISMGVLHHTKNCRKALKKISSFVSPKGYLYIGLYHSYGRQPMLDFLQGYARWYGTNSAFNLFKVMNRNMTNQDHLYSWFRDQVLHPRETQHSLKEICKWLDEIKFDLISTSINNYKRISTYSSNSLFSFEKDFKSLSYESNVNELIFNPGFFTICARKR